MPKYPTYTFNEIEAALDVSNMNHLEKGSYFDLVLAQRKFGKFTFDQIKKIIGKDFKHVWESLECVLVHENGFYYIQWLKDSLEKKQTHANIQRKRIQDYWDKIKSDNTNNKAIDEYHGITAEYHGNTMEYHGNTTEFSEITSEDSLNIEVLQIEKYHGNSMEFSVNKNDENLTDQISQSSENSICETSSLQNTHITDIQGNDEYHGITTELPRNESEEIKDAIIYNNIDISNNIEISNNYNNKKEKLNKRKKVSDNMDESEKPTWRNSFEVYKLGLDKVYNELKNDQSFIQQQEKYFPNVDISLSLEMAYNNFWGTEAGWKHKKKQRSNEINWKLTLVNAIKMNKVYKQRFQQTPPSNDRVQHKDLTTIFNKVTKQ